MFVWSLAQFASLREMNSKRHRVKCQNPRMTLMGQRRIVDLVVAFVLQAGGELSAEIVQSHLVLQHGDLYYAYVGPGLCLPRRSQFRGRRQPGNWKAFLSRHRDAFSVCAHNLYVHRRPRKQLMIQAWSRTEN